MADETPVMFRRRKKLILPGLQLRLTGSFLGVALVGLLLQYLLMHNGLMREAQAVPGAGGELAQRVPGVTLRALFSVMAIVVPLLVVVGVWRTFRVAGPIYRLGVFLEDVRDGKQVEPCRLRANDELKDLCELVNEVTAEARERAGRERGAESGTPAKAA